MIIDTLENGDRYGLGTAWTAAIDFLRTLPADCAEGEYPIAGEGIFARVMSYRTKEPQEALLEAHRNYLDIQSVLVGSEMFECFPTETLEIDVPYDPLKDATFYRRPGIGPVRVDVVAGRFLALFPQDAHMAGLVDGTPPQKVKKVVVKVRLDLLRS
jgi:YhcH/YjgK/YiaL family protein